MMHHKCTIQWVEIYNLGAKWEKRTHANRIIFNQTLTHSVASKNNIFLVNSKKFITTPEIISKETIIWLASGPKLL